MDNLENYLYILLAVIYIISRIIKARGKQNQTKPRTTQPPAQPVQSSGQVKKQKPRKTFSFEDILKEFEQNLAGEEESSYEKPLPVKEIKHEKPAPVPVAEKRPDPYESYQGTSYASETKPKDTKETASFERSDKYSIKDSIASEYVKMLKDPEGFKNAIVLSEIINRKYF